MSDKKSQEKADSKPETKRRQVDVEPKAASRGHALPMPAAQGDELPVHSNAGRYRRQRMIQLQRLVGNRRATRLLGDRGQTDRATHSGTSPRVSDGVAARIQTAQPQLIQRAPKGGKLSGMDWRNLVIGANNSIQKHIRWAQSKNKGRVQFDLVLEPDFVSSENPKRSGKAPSGSEPDGYEVYLAAQKALDLLASSAPSSRRVHQVTLERTASGWTMTSQFLISQSMAAGQGQQSSVAESGGVVADILKWADSIKKGAVRADIIIAGKKLKIGSWKAYKPVAKQGQSRTAGIEKSVREFHGLIASSAKYPVVYAYDFEVEKGAWTIKSLQHLATVKPAPPKAAGGASRRPAQPDEGEMIIQDVKRARQLVLTSAATMIAEMDPTRLDNMLFSVGPFALAKVGKLGKLAKIGKIAKLIGRPARRIFGEVKFKGLVKGRAIKDLTHAEIFKAFENTPFKPSNHCIKRIKDSRTANLGVTKLDDVARHLNRGIIDDAGKGLISIRHQSFEMIVNPKTRILVTFKPI